MKEMKDEIVQACRNKIKTIVKQTIREELVNIKRELEDMKQNIQGSTAKIARSGQKSYSETVNEKKESILIVKPKKEHESKTTKKVVKEKVGIKNLAIGITKLRKGGTRTDIWLWEREMKQLKDSMSENLGKDFEIVRTKKD